MLLDSVSRRSNKVWSTTPHCHLRQLSHTLALPNAQNLWFVKLNVTNFYLSQTVLQGAKLFALFAGSSTYARRRLPHLTGTIPTGGRALCYFACLRGAVHARLSHFCVVVDNQAAYYTAIFGRVSAFHLERVRLVQGINLLSFRA